MPANDFTTAEYARRLQKTRAAMAARGLKTLVICDPSNMAWLTGYDGWSFYVPQAVILHEEGMPLWWGRTQDKPGAALPHERTIDTDGARLSIAVSAPALDVATPLPTSASPAALST